MSFWVPLAMGLGSAVLEGQKAGDVRQQRLLEAEIARNSPWTGMQAQRVQSADPLGAAVQGGAAGLGMMQNMSAADSANELQKQQMTLQQRQADNQNNLTQAQIDYLKSMQAQGGQKPPVPMG